MERGTGPARKSGPVQLGDALRATIDAVVGARSHTAEAMVVDHPEDGHPLLVVVVERDPIPTDAELRSLYGLTPRETEVARLMVRRLSTREMSDHLGISVHTVRHHCERVRAKVGVHSRNDVRHALTACDPAGDRDAA